MVEPGFNGYSGLQLFLLYVWYHVNTFINAVYHFFICPTLNASHGALLLTIINLEGGGCYLLEEAL